MNGTINAQVNYETTFERTIKPNLFCKLVEINRKLGLVLAECEAMR